MNRRLYRSADDRVLAGVAGGIAETYDFDPALVRVAWALLILLSGGTLLILYIIMAIVIPLAPDAVPGGPGYWASDASMPGTASTPGMAPAEAGLAGGGTAPTGMAGSGTAGAPVAAAMMSERERRRMMRHQPRGGNDIAGALVFGLILILIGAFLLLRTYVPAINWGQIWPIGLIGIGALLLLAALFRPSGR